MIEDLPEPTPRSATDLEVARAAATSRGAFAALYHAHVDRVWARLTRLIGPIAEREDLLQQVFWQVHRALVEFRGDASLATFIQRIATNVALDHLRALRRRPVLTSDDFAELVAADDDPARRAAARAELALLFELVQALPVDKRVAFVLIAVEGLSLREAAAQLDAAPDTIKQRALSARRLIEAALAARAKGRS